MEAESTPPAPTLLPPDLDAFRLHLIQRIGKKPSTAGLYMNVAKALVAAYPQGAGYSDTITWILSRKPAYTGPAVRYFNIWCARVGYPVVWDTEQRTVIPIVCSEAHHALWSLLDNCGVEDRDMWTLTWEDFWPIWSKICRHAGEKGGAALSTRLVEVARSVQDAGQGGALVFAATTGSRRAGDVVFTVDQIMAAGPGENNESS